MAYIVVADRNGEVDRRELKRPLVIGRAPDCDVVIRDILLSRRHCTIEPMGDQWIIADLGSKNGTFVQGQPITRHLLSEGDVVQIGRSKLCFREGVFVPAPSQAPSRSVRPVDPREALAGTVAGFRYVEDEAELVDVSHFPRPKPRPPAPGSYQRENVHELVSDIASSSWDSILANASRKIPPERPLPSPMLIKRKRVEHEAQQSLRAHPSDIPHEPAIPANKPSRASRDHAAPRRKIDVKRWLSLVTIGASTAAMFAWLWFLSWEW